MGRDFLSLFPDLDIEDLRKLPSPFYLYSEQKIRNNIQHLLQTGKKYFPDFHLHYALKANGNPHILKIFQQEGVSVDCSAPVELELAHRIDFPIEDCLYTGNYESQEDFQRVLQYDCILNLDDARRMAEVFSIKIPEVLSFRINPGIGRGAHEGIVTGGEKAKFGIPHELSGEVYSEALERGAKKLGIHIMTGSNVLEPEHFLQITERIFDIIEEHISPLNIQLEFINIGGGLGVPYRPEEKTLDLEATFRNIKSVFDSRLSKLNIGQPKLAMEPGRYLVADAGCIVARVQHIKESYRRFLGMDAGMSTLLRPAMYQAYHHIEVLNQAKDEENYYVCGQICENSDVFPEERRLKKAQVGDLLAIHNAGAYGFCMASHYNHRERPAEYLWTQNKELNVIRKPEVPADMFRNVPDFQW